MTRAHALILAAFSVGFGAVSVAHAADTAPIVMTPDQLKWSSAGGMPGVSEAWLVGQPGKPGFYVVRRHFKLGGQLLPRADAQTVFLTVLSGDVYAGIDNQIDPRTAKRLPVGTFVIFPGGSYHYLWARYGEAVVQEWGALPGNPAAPSSTLEPATPRP